MIVKTTRKPSPMSGYKKYFMFEAPGDEDEETPTPKANTKVIKINPDDKRRTDYTQYVPDPDANDGGEETNQTDDTGDATTDIPEDTPVDDTTDTGTEEPTTTDEPDTTADETTPEDTPQDDTAAPETGDGGTDTGTEPMIDETDYGTGDDTTQDAPENTDTADTPVETDVQTDDTDYTTDNETDTETDAGDNEPTTDDTDYTAGDDAGDGDTETDTTDDTNQDDTTQQNTGLDDPDDKTHKFILFKKCISLESALSNYIQKLSGIMSDDLECNHIYKKITNNLKELDEMLHDYMTIKFENATYIQSMLFYQRLLASVGINLDMLKHIRQKEIKMNDKKSKH